MIQISAGEFKAKCLKLMDFTEQKHETIVITKRGVPIAKLVPYEDKPPRVFGFLKNSVQIIGDIVEPIKEDWDAEKT
jgi:prevent-host-death family protein